MKIYLSQTKPTDSSYLWVSNMQILDNSVDNNEAREIIVDRYISGFLLPDVEKLLDKIISKIRLNGELIIIETDIDLITMKYFRNELDLNNLNNLLLKTGLLRSVLNIEYIETCLKSKINIYSKHMDNETGLIILKCKRLT